MDVGRDGVEDLGVDAVLATWAASGAMALTGREDGPPSGPPAPLVPRLVELGDALARHSGTEGTVVRIDPVALLGERAAIAGLTRHGDVSCGGSARLLRAADGWLAVNLARDDDVALLPAWLEVAADRFGGDLTDGDPWPALVEELATRSVDPLVERAALLGLPAAALPALPDRRLVMVDPAQPGKPSQDVIGVGQTPAAPFTGLPAPFTGLPVRVTGFGPAEHRVRSGLRVVDLTALWAGPLAGHLLALGGAEVIKVESTARPDGARRGPAAFFDLLNAGKRSVAVDLADPEGVRALRALLASADLVLEAARPRALAAYGITAAEVLGAENGPTAWISITGYGRDDGAGAHPGRVAFGDGPGRVAFDDGPGRAAFGDDAAVAGGLVVRDALGPCFCADAVADPITGLVAAVAGFAAMAGDRRWLVDVAMAEVSAWCAGPTLPVDRGPVNRGPVNRGPGNRGPVDRGPVDRGPMMVAAPHARTPLGRAAALGHDTRAVLGPLVDLR